MRSRASSKLANCARFRKSWNIVFQNLSIFPSVIGWCGWLRMCFTRSLVSSISNLVVPRHAVYCRPLSVSISLGTPYSVTAFRYTSSTFSAVWLVNSPSPTIYLEWSSMNPIRYDCLPPRRKVKMSLCHIWFGVERSKKRGRTMFFSLFFLVGVSFSSLCS